MTHRAATAARSRLRPSARRPARQLRLHLRRRPELAQPERDRLRRRRRLRLRLVAVTVNNVAPTIAISGAASVNEGSVYSLTLGAVTDPGTDTVSSYVVHWGDGSHRHLRPATASKTHTYADGAQRLRRHRRPGRRGRHLPRPRQTTTRCTSTTSTPTVTLTRRQPVTEGSTHTYSYTTTDPGSPETFSRDAQSCDGGTLSGATFNSATGAGSFDCTYADGPSSHNPSVTVSDGDGGSDSDSSRSRSQRRPVDRDQRRGERQRGLGLQPDPGRGHRPRHRHGHELHRALGRRQHRQLRSNGVKTHTYADGPTTTTSPSTWSTRTAPSSTARTTSRCTSTTSLPRSRSAAPPSVNEGSAYSLTLGAVTDPGTDTVSSYVVHWGDGNSEHLRHQRRQVAHLRRRPQRPRRHGRPGRRGRHLPRPRQRLLGARRQRRPDGHALEPERPERQRVGLDRAHLQLLDLRPGRRRRQLGLDQLRRQRRQGARLRTRTRTRAAPSSAPSRTARRRRPAPSAQARPTTTVTPATPTRRASRSPTSPRPPT